MPEIPQTQHALHCQSCSISQLCLPFTLNEKELTQLDNIIERKRPLQKAQVLFRTGEPLQALYALRTGSIKSYVLNEKGEEQITAFHFSGDLIGFDAIANLQHTGFAEALETSMVCEIPYSILDELASKMPKVRHQILRLMSHEIRGDQQMILLLSKMSAEEKLAAFLYSLSQRFAAQGFSAREFRLPMTRGEIANYLGLTIETISRLLGRFQKNGLLTVEGKYVKIESLLQLEQLSGGIISPAIPITQID